MTITKSPLYPHGGSCKFIVLEAYTNKPSSISETVRRLNLNLSTVARWTKELHRERAIYIADWKVGTKGGRMAVYAPGTAPDARKVTKPLYEPPPGLSPEEQARRQQIIDDAEEQQLQAALARKRELARKQPVKRDPMVAALFGAAKEAA